MIFTEGLPKHYSLLRNQNPSIFYLEDFYFKLLQLNIDKEFNISLDNEVIEEDIVTVNFPEFLDVSYSLSFIKKIFFSTDVCFSKPGDITLTETNIPLNLVDLNKQVSDYLPTPARELDTKTFKPFPEGMITLLFGYRYTAVKDVRTKLENVESLCCEQLVQMEDDCFNWIPIDLNDSGLNGETNKPTVAKFKVEISLSKLKEWLIDVFTEEEFPIFIDRMLDTTLDINFILHPPYIDRMSFKDNIRIVYPLKSTRLKTIDKVIFRSNRSYTINNKLYYIHFVDKDTSQKLYSFNSIDNSRFFENLSKVVDTKKMNSYFNQEIVTFEDSILVTFNVPSSVQLALAKHKNYKIQIVAKDLTTHNRGNNVRSSV